VQRRREHEAQPRASDHDERTSTLSEYCA
jgi:hypothetical protein